MRQNWTELVTALFLSSIIDPLRGLELRWQVPGLRVLRQDGADLLARHRPVIQGVLPARPRRQRGPALLAPDRARPLGHGLGRQDGKHCRLLSGKM